MHMRLLRREKETSRREIRRGGLLFWSKKFAMVDGWRFFFVFSVALLPTRPDLNESRPYPAPAPPLVMHARSARLLGQKSVAWRRIRTKRVKLVTLISSFSAVLLLLYVFF